MQDFDFGLGEDIDTLRTTVAKFAAERIAPLAADIDRDNRFPRELWPELGDLGLLGITVEEDLGGTGLGYLAQRQLALVYGATIVVMGFGALGVIRALRRNLDVECACMGTVLKVPLSTVALTEDLGMVAMAGAMWLAH